LTIGESSLKNCRPRRTNPGVQALTGGDAQKLTVNVKEKGGKLVLNPEKQSLKGSRKKDFKGQKKNTSRRCIEKGQKKDMRDQKRGHRDLQPGKTRGKAHTQNDRITKFIGERLTKGEIKNAFPKNRVDQKKKKAKMVKEREKKVHGGWRQGSY